MSTYALANIGAHDFASAENAVAVNSTSRAQLVDVSAASIVGMAVFTPTTTSLATTGLSVTVPAAVRQMNIQGSTGTCWNYNATATTATNPVPTTVQTIQVSAADVKLLQWIQPTGGTGVVTLIFQG